MSTDERPAEDERVEVDFAAVFAAQPTAYLVMSPELVIVEANPAYLRLLGRTRDELVGRYVFDAFPPAPESLDADGVNPLQVSFERARDTGEPDPMPLFRYEVLDHRTGRLARRAWSLISVPVRDAEGRTRLVLQRVEDVSEYLAERERLTESRHDGSWVGLDGLEADLFTRTQELRAALEAREHATQRLAAMAQVVMRMAEAATVEGIVDILAGAGLAAIGADGGAIALRDDEHGVVRLILTPSLGEGAQQRFATIDLDSRLPAAWAARTGETVIYESQAEAEAWSPEMREAFLQSGQRAWITVPLTTDGRLLGSLLAGWVQERTFSPEEVDLVQAFGVQCAQALGRAQALTAERREARSSRLLAERLQRSMLTEPFQPEDCEIVVRYVPATGAAQVGGDWYDTFLHADGAINLVIGDVVGHDTGAAAMMGQLRSLLRGIGVSGDLGPAEVLDRLDRAITQLDLATYATVGLGRLEQTSEAGGGVALLRWATAGHLPPLVIDDDGAFVEIPEVAGRLMLGVDHTRSRGESVVELRRGATVLLYTDGLVERPGGDLDAGVAALQEAVAEFAHLPVDELCDRVVDRLVQGRPDDDVALVAVRLHGEDCPREAGAGPGAVPTDTAGTTGASSRARPSTGGPMGEVSWPRRRPPLPAPGPTAAVLPTTDAPASARQMSQLRRRLRSAVHAALPTGTAVSDDVLADALERLELVIEELTSNGRRHGRTPVRVAVHAADDGWLVSVTDAAPDRPPRPALDRDPAEGGMGLRMVARLAIAHGWNPTGEDKTVWAVVAAG